MTGPVAMEELTARLVNAFEHVRAKVVALCLQQISGQTSLTHTIKVRERAGDGRSGHTVQNRGRGQHAPVVLRNSCEREI